MKKLSRFLFLGIIGFGQQIQADSLNIQVAPYPEEKVHINYYRLGLSDLDTNFEKDFGPNYVVPFDIAARNESPRVVTDLLEKRYKDQLKIVGKPLLLPFGSLGDFRLNPVRGIDYRGNYGIGGMIHEGTYFGNPLVTAAMHGRLPVVKAIVKWIKAKLTERKTMDEFQSYLNAPAANFGVGKTDGQFIVGTALIFALLNGHYDIVEYLLSQGAVPEGVLVKKGVLSPDGDKKIALIIRTKNGIANNPENIDVEELILASKIKLDPKLEASLKKVVAERLQQKNRQEKEKQDRLQKEQEDKKDIERYLTEQAALDKQYRLEKLQKALGLSRAELGLPANQSLLRDAGKAVWQHPEFFELVVTEHPDLAEYIKTSAFTFGSDPAKQAFIEQIQQKQETPITRLYSSIKANDIVGVKAIIEKHPELVNKEFAQMTPILYCGNRLDILKYLESKGADIHAQNNKLLYYAAGAGDREVVKYLIEKKGFKITPEVINIARTNNTQEILEYLLNKTA